MGDTRCPGDNEPGLTDESANPLTRRARKPRILDSLRSRTGARTSRKRAPTCTVCNLELATDFGGMHLPPAVKGLPVLSSACCWRGIPGTKAAEGQRDPAPSRLPAKRKWKRGLDRVQRHESSRVRPDLRVVLHHPTLATWLSNRSRKRPVEPTTAARRASDGNGNG